MKIKSMLVGLFFLLMLNWVEAQTLKVITFNVRYANDTDGNNKWALRKDIASDFLAYEAPDFFGLQEAKLIQIEDVQENIKGYEWIGVGRDDGKEGGEYTPIFYRTDTWKLIDFGTFWLSETPGQPSKSWDSAFPRICTWGEFEKTGSNQRVTVFNTHFDHVGELARSNGARMILDSIQSKAGFQRCVLIGDLNAEESDDPIQILSSKLLDVYKVARLTYGGEGTYNGFDYEKIPTRRIDYVFVPEEARVLKYGVDSRIIDGRYLSDHFPVIVELKLK